MRPWLVGSALIESAEGLLLAGLTREVHEEAGLRVMSWDGPVFRLEAEPADAGWHLRVEVHRAAASDGEPTVDDPDGIVVDARFVPVEECSGVLASAWQHIHEPLGEWMTERWAGERQYRYRNHGAARSAMQITRL